MKTNLNKCWKLIGGGVAASCLLATSVVAPLTTNKYQIKKQNKKNNNADVQTADAYQFFRDQTSDTVKGTITYTIDNNQLTIITPTAENDWTDLTIKGSGEITPQGGGEAVSYSSVKIGDLNNVCFYNCRDKVKGNWILENGVSCGDASSLDNWNGFYGCALLNSITFPNNLQKITDVWFNGCSGLTDVFFPSSITTIGDDAFGRTSLATISLSGNDPSYSFRWSGQAFENNFDGTYVNIQTVYVPPNALDNYKSSLPNYSWFTNDGLTASNIQPYPIQSADADKFFTSTSGDTVTGTVCYIDNGDGTITLLPDNSTESSEATVTTNVVGKNLQLDTESTGKIEMPVSTIDSECFGLSQITGTLDLSNCTALTSIGRAAFANNTGSTSYNDITSVNLPGNITDFGSMIFAANHLNSIQCTTNDNYKVWNPNPNSNAEVLVPKNTTEWTNDTYALGGIACGDIDLRSYSFKALNDHAFSGSPITGILLPDGLTKIDGLPNFEGGAFAGCALLKSINLPTSIETIADSAFGTCYNLQSINSDELLNLTTIGSSAFMMNNNLEDFIVPKNVTTIGRYAFATQSEESLPSKFTSVTFQNTNPSWISGLDNEWLGGEYALVKTINVPEGCKTAYQNEYAKLYQAGTYDWFKDGMSWEEYTPPAPSDNNLNLGIALGVSLGICIGIPGIVGGISALVYNNKRKKRQENN